MINSYNSEEVPANLSCFLGPRWLVRFFVLPPRFLSLCLEHLFVVAKSMMCAFTGSLPFAIAGTRRCVFVGAVCQNVCKAFQARLLR